MKWAFIWSVILCNLTAVSAQTTGLNGFTLETGMAWGNPDEFNTNVFPRLESWGMGNEQMNQLTTFTLLTHEQKKWLDYGLYGSYAFTNVRGEAEYFSPETVLSSLPAHVGETSLSLRRISIGIHVGTDVLQLLSARNDLRIEWFVRARAGLGSSSIMGKVDRYSLLNRRTEVEVNRSGALFAESQVSTEIAFKLNDRLKVGAFAAVFTSRTQYYNLGEITRRPEDAGTRVRFDFSGFSGGLLFGYQF